VVEVEVEEYWHDSGHDDDLDQSFATDSDDQHVVHGASGLQEWKEGFHQKEQNP
jgi:hypothetical protein